MRFYHPAVGELIVHTGADSISWGYVLNTANFPTYGGEVVQILSCYIDDLQIEGTLRNYGDLEALYGYFIGYLKEASAGGSRDERPMVCEYPHRGWSFDIIVKSVPGYRKSRDLVVPQWQIQAQIVDDTGDVDDLKNLIINEAQIKAAIGSDDPDFDENFGLEGKIRFVDENPFSDPWTNRGQDFGDDRNRPLNTIGDYYTKLLPSYLKGNFDTVFNQIGSKPSFNPTLGPKGNIDTDVPSRQAIKKAAKKKKKGKG